MLTGDKIIVLNCLQIELVKLSRKEKMLILAHEFAHEILGHTHDTIEEEKEANALMEKWGFASMEKFGKKLKKMEISYLVRTGKKISIPEVTCPYCGKGYPAVWR